MSNPFSTNNLIPQLSNYPVAKGGPGSGRYPAGSDNKQKAGDLEARAYELLASVSDEGADSSFAREHHAIAEGHREIADALNNKAGYEGGHSSEERLRMKELADQHTAADVAHEEAADAHDKAVKALDLDPDMDEVETQDAVNEAQNASDSAYTASLNASDALEDEDPNLGSQLGMGDLFSPAQISEFMRRG